MFFEIISILIAWSQYMTLEPNCIKNLWNFETTHRSGSVFVVKWENFSANGSGCKGAKGVQRGGNWGVVEILSSSFLVVISMLEHQIWSVWAADWHTFYDVALMRPFWPLSPWKPKLQWHINFHLQLTLKGWWKYENLDFFHIWPLF